MACAVATVTGQSERRGWVTQGQAKVWRGKEKARQVERDDDDVTITWRDRHVVVVVVVTSEQREWGDTGAGEGVARQGVARQGGGRASWAWRRDRGEGKAK